MRLKQFREKWQRYMYTATPPKRPWLTHGGRGDHFILRTVSPSKGETVLVVHDRDKVSLGYRTRELRICWSVGNNPDPHDIFTPRLPVTNRDWVGKVGTALVHSILTDLDSDIKVDLRPVMHGHVAVGGYVPSWERGVGNTPFRGYPGLPAKYITPSRNLKRWCENRWYRKYW